MGRAGSTYTLAGSPPGQAGAKSEHADRHGRLGHDHLSWSHRPSTRSYRSTSISRPGALHCSARRRTRAWTADLVEIGSFGEGLNVGPTVGFNLPVNNALILTGSVGYTGRGSFERENDPILTTTTKLRPGEALTVTGSIGYQSNQFTARLTGTISQETATKQDGVEVAARAGQRLLFAGVFAYAWPADLGQTTLNTSLAHSGRNKVRLPGTSALVTEAFNANSNLFRIGIEHVFEAGRLQFGPIGSFLYRDNNGYDSTTLQFVPAKERWAAGATARYAISDSSR